jgi:hypothetical protein
MLISKSDVDEKFWNYYSFTSYRKMKSEFGANNPSS